MPATKRKRSNGRRSYSRSYKRRGGVSVGGVVRALAKANASMGPFGPGSANYEKYGPSKRQMLANPGLSITPAQKQQRMLDHYYGDGDYTRMGHWGSRIGGAALGAMQGFASGGMPGAISGIAPGWDRGASFSKSMGWGDYSSPRVTNQIVEGSGDTGIVINDSDLSGDVVLTNREFVGNVISSTTGTPLKLQKYGINPANASTFPFLSNIAKNFELYEWQGLGFQYIPTSGEGDNQTLGKVIMVTNYDPGYDGWSDSTALSTLQNYDYASSCKPSVGMFHGVETASDKRVVKQMYIDGSDDSSSRDQIFRTLGNFYVGVQGLTAGTAAVTVGELWVTYRVKLSRMRLAGELYGFNEGVYRLTGELLAVSTYPNLHTVMQPLSIFTNGLYQRLNERVNIGMNQYEMQMKSTKNDTLITKVYHSDAVTAGVVKVYVFLRRNMLSVKSRVYLIINWLLQTGSPSSAISQTNANNANALEVDVLVDGKATFVNTDTNGGILGHDGPKDNNNKEAGVTRIVCIRPANYYQIDGSLDTSDIMVEVLINVKNVSFSGTSIKHDFSVRAIRVNPYGEGEFSSYSGDMEPPEYF